MSALRPTLSTKGAHFAASSGDMSGAEPKQYATARRTPCGAASVMERAELPSPSRRSSARRAATPPPMEWPVQTTSCSGHSRKAAETAGCACSANHRAERAMPVWATPPATSQVSAARSVRSAFRLMDPLTATTIQRRAGARKTTNAGSKVRSIQDERMTSSGCAPASWRKALSSFDVLERRHCATAAPAASAAASSPAPSRITCP
mmetsp:Transcript_20878/g.57983  ORF Transcript_20878/g.57983 Transcript_20878/m.57983 type:complete len:206 (+) Transcript_20878:678-1295(+)